jgi:hypothetical protein
MWCIHPLHSGQTSHLLSSKIRRLGHLSLAFELGHQPYLRPPGNIAAAMGPPLRQYHTASTAVHGSERWFAHSLPKVSIGCTFLGQLKHCPPCYIFPSSFSLLVFSFICSTSTTLPSVSRLRGFCISFMPLFWYDSPYYTPLSSSIWFFFAGMPVVALKVRGLIQYRHPPAIGTSAWLRFADLESRYRIRLFGGIGKMAENAALEPSAEMDIRVLKWTLNALDEDHEWERFFVGIPGFCSSNDGWSMSTCCSL